LPDDDVTRHDDLSHPPTPSLSVTEREGESRLPLSSQERRPEGVGG
jgi:hypothetical protein